MNMNIKYLHLILRLSPIGLIHKIKCRLSLTLSIKVAYMVSGSLILFRASLIGLISSSIFFLTSGSHKLGISPLFSKLLISSRKASSII